MAEVFSKVSRVELEDAAPVKKLTIAGALRSSTEVLKEIARVYLRESAEVPSRVVSRFNEEYERLSQIGQPPAD